MAKSALELAVETGKWDAGLKKAKSALDSFTEANGGLQKALSSDSDKMKQFVQMMGRTESTAKTAKGQMNDYKGTIEALTMQYNRMTDAQKSAVGPAYLQAIEQMKQRYKGVADEVAKINQELKQTSTLSDNIQQGGTGGGGLFGGGKIDGMLQVFGGNLMTKGAGMLAGLASEMGDMVKQGIELAKQGEGIRIAFQRLGRGDILDGLRQATHGTVTDLELMKAAVKFSDFKLPLDELGTMLAFAQQKAKDTGQSVDYMVDSIVTGLGRKSLMILDNLGLSAAQIKERMAETGDMTKAVGAIIREEMAKAGDYVETAADRATQANVQLENAMTRLGETFQPLTDTANSMWTSIKIGALDLLNNAVKPLIDAFTEAGRARALYEKQGGDTRVNRQLDRLKGIQNDNYRRGTYKAQLRNYDTQIASHEQYLKDYKAWQRDNTNVGAYNRMQAFQQQTGLQWVSDVQAHLDAFKKMRAEYVQGAKAIIEGNPVPSPTSTTTTNKTGGTTTTTHKPTTAEQIAFDINKAGISSAKGVDTMPSVWAMLGDKGLRQMLGISAPAFDLGRDISTQWQLNNKGQLVQKKDKDAQNADKTIVSEMGKLTSGVSGIFSGIEQMGIEVPDEIKNVINGLNGVMTILTSINTILGVIEGLQTVGVIPFFARGGIVPHAATGLVVPGNDHADRTPALVSSGELILNSAQQNALANELQGGGLRNLRLRTEVSGRNLIVVIENDLAARGKGQLVTFKS